jgi:hypothetical protein
LRRRIVDAGKTGEPLPDADKLYLDPPSGFSLQLALSFELSRVQGLQPLVRVGILGTFVVANPHDSGKAQRVA